MWAYYKPNLSLAKTVSIIKDNSIPEAFIQLRSDGIVHVHFKKDIILDIPLQMRLLEQYKIITGEKLTPFMFTAAEGLNVTPEARDNAVKMEEFTPCYVTAVVVTNVAYLLIANFYLKFNKPKRPYRVFKNEEMAIEWLKTFVQ